MEIARILDWPYQKAETIFLNIGISKIDGTPADGLTNDQILIALLWYHINILVKKQSPPTRGV